MFPVYFLKFLINSSGAMVFTSDALQRINCRQEFDEVNFTEFSSKQSYRLSWLDKNPLSQKIELCCHNKNFANNKNSVFDNHTLL